MPSLPLASAHQAFALTPAEYVSGTVNPAGGIPGNGEVPVKLFIDASATTQAGYRLYLFFP